MESLLTFGPMLFDMFPMANDYKLCLKFHSSVIIFFTVLNVYLHCGYTFDWIEAILPKLMINSSGYHNIHHARTHSHFAELLTLWDYLKNTGATYYNKEKFEKA